MSASIVYKGVYTGLLLSQMNLEHRLIVPATSQFMKQIRYYAARKGYRDKKKKAQVKKVVVKKEFSPFKQKLASSTLQRKQRTDESNLAWPSDDVWKANFFRKKVYPFAEVVQCHRETHHPTVYNEPEALLNVKVELNMKAVKKNRFLDSFTDIVLLPYPFDMKVKRKVLAFGKTPESQKEAADAGATMVGGVELIKSILVGELLTMEYEYVIAHTNILQELAQLRGLLKKKFPTLKNGTAGMEIAKMVTRITKGLEYTASIDEHEKHFGWIHTSVGTLNMETSHMEENLQALADNIMSHRPKRDSPFITRMLLTSPPSKEIFKINHTLYSGELMEQEEEGKAENEKEEEENEGDIQKESAVKSV